MFEAKTSRGHVIRRLFDVISGLVDDIALEVSMTGISMQGMDTSHVALVTFTLHAAEFDFFRCDRPQKIGLKMKILQKIMKTSGPNDSLAISTDDDSDTVTFVFQSSDDRVAKFKIAQSEIESSDLFVPEQDYKASFDMPAALFQRICRDLGSMGDSLQIAVTRTSVTFETTGDAGEGSVTLRGAPKGEDDAIDADAVLIEVAEPLSNVFSVRFLSNFAKAAGPSVLVCL